MNNETVNNLVKALVHSLLSILSFVFVTPYKLWLKAAERLSAQKDAGSLNLTNIKSDWPLLSYFKRFTLDFYFDAIAFLAYPLGIILAIYAGIDVAGEVADINKTVAEFGGEKQSVFGAFMSEFMITTLTMYFYPVICYLLHDLLVIILLPFRKFIDWAKKPAQQMDLDIKNRE